MFEVVAVIVLAAIGATGYVGLKFFYHHYTDEKSEKEQAEKLAAAY